jgi:cytochrome c peroxidase
MQGRFRALKSSSLVAASIFAVLILSLAACRKNPVGPQDPVGDLEDVPYNPQPYTIAKPSFFPEVPVPADNPMTVDGVQLGRRLFYDPILSADGTMSCSSCHLPAGSFTDNKAVSIGIDGLPGKRSSMSLLNIAYANTGLFWDGRAATLEEQALLPVEDPVELHHTWPQVVEELKTHPTYPELFRKAFGIADRSEITKELAAKAIAQFERILISSGTSRYDRYKQGDHTALDDDEIDGMIMFFDEAVSVGVNLPDAQCFHCHQGDMLNSADYFSNGLDAVSDWNGYTDRGRGTVTGVQTDNGKFRSPTLRNIALTAPYMHDGRFQTLEEVVDHYGEQGKSQVPYQHLFVSQIGFVVPNSNPVQYQPLSVQHKQALVKFLHTLTDTAFINNPDIQSPF